MKDIREFTEKHIGNKYPTLKDEHEFVVSLASLKKIVRVAIGKYVNQNL